MSASRNLLCLLSGFVVGCVSAFCVAAAVWHSETFQAKYHWSRFEAYMQYINNPDNPTDEPYDVMPSLATLVSLGELDHVDLVFPRVFVDDELNVYLNLFYREHHRDVVFVEYNPQHSRGFSVSGRQPLHLQLWFRPDADDKVRELVRTIENRYGEGAGGSSLKQDRQDEKS